jgi:hypothetical protein
MIFSLTTRPAKHLILLLLVVFSPLAILSLHGQVGAQQIGGSNYVIYDLGNYPLQPYATSTIKPVIPYFHENPGLVEQQLQAMYAGGQRKISLVLYYAPLSAGTAVSGLDVNSSTSSPSAQVSTNIQNLLTLINKIGFNEVFFRFAYDGPSISTWQSWNETQYQQNWNFELAVRNIVEQTLSATSMKRTYDLGLEIGGDPDGQAPAYMTRLWTDYCHVTGCTDSYGFSIAWKPNSYTTDPGMGTRLTNEIVLLTATNYPLPKMYGLDVYDNEYQAFLSAYNSLQLEKQSSASIVVQEAYYNDRDTINQMYYVQNLVPLSIYTVFQWPFVRASLVPDFSVPYPAAFDQYNSLPFIAGATAYSSANGYWMNINGVLPSQATINLYSGTWSMGRTPIATFTVNGVGSATGFIVPPSAAAGGSSLNVQVVNPQTGDYSDPKLVSLN